MPFFRELLHTFNAMSVKTPTHFLMGLNKLIWKKMKTPKAHRENPEGKKYYVEEGEGPLLD